MKSTRRSRNLQVVVFAILSLLAAFQLWGVQWIPFHPDESTYFFMSRDFDIFLRAPLEIAWQPEREGSIEQRDREIAPPLIRYLLGMGRWAAHLPPTPIDWDWGKTWAENQATGALPSPALLFAGRMAISLLLPLSMLGVYLIGRRLDGRAVGLFAALFFGLHPLILLHNRRAMAEGPLTLGVIFALWSFLDAPKRPWLAGLAVGLAVSAKHSALALLPVGLLALLWEPPAAHPALPSQPWRRRAINIFQYLAVMGAVILALNPIWWNQPWRSIPASLAARQKLAYTQSNELEQVAPTQVLHSLPERTLGMLVNLFLAPPVFAELGNYTQNTQTSEATYQAILGHWWPGGLVTRAIFFFLTLSGLLVTLLRLRHVPPAQRRNLSLLLITGAAQAAFHLAAVPIAWQRYVVPMLPTVCLLAALVISPLSKRAEQPEAKAEFA